MNQPLIGRVCALLLLAGAPLSLHAAAPALPAERAPAEAAQPGGVQPAAVMLRYPAVSATHVAFVYANQIWLAPRAGGTATPLASPPGQSSFPRFSPDGATLAFIGNYEGNRDIYTVPVAGGIPQRVTHHPGNESLCEWSPNGRLLFLSNGLAGLARQTQLFSVAPEGGLPEKLPMPYGGFGSVSPDGQSVAYTPHSTDTRTWKRYRGGMATDVWLLNLSTGQSRQITDWEGTDTLPMWGRGRDAGTVYYLSDNGPEHRLNIWAFDTATGRRTQVTTFADDDVRWPSMGPGAGGQGEIVFQLGAKLMLLDLATKRSTQVTVTIPGARPTIKPRPEDVSRGIANSAISPNARRVVAEARGDLWSLPAKEGVVRQLTRSSGVFERDPAWSPDGRWIAYFSDESGEYELWVRSSDAKPPEEKKDDKPADARKDDPKKDEPKKDEPADEPAGAPKTQPVKLTNLGPGFRYMGRWSPDSKHLTWVEEGGKLQMATLTVKDGAVTAEVKTIDTDPHSGRPSVSWSADSAWLAYERSDERSRNGCIWFYNVKTGEKTRVTDPMFNSGSPAIDPKGEWLFFSSNRSFSSAMYGDLDTTWVYNNTDVLAMAPLRTDVKSPFAPKTDEEELKKDDKKEDKKPDAKPADKPGEKKDDAPTSPAAPDDGLSGSWTGKASGGTMPPEGMPFTFTVRLAPDGTVSATFVSAVGRAEFTGTFDKASGKLALSGVVNDAPVTLEATVRGQDITGTWKVNDEAGEWTAKRNGRAAQPPQPAKPDEPKKDEPKKDDPKKPKELKIDFEGLEARAIQIPVPPGQFGGLTALDDGKLLYIRAGSRGSGDAAGIKIFDPKDEARDEKTVIAGAGGYELAAAAKKILVQRGSSLTIYDAAPGGGKAQAVPTSPMRTTVNPREEWRQILTDTWRLQRDFFYEPTMHGVDWAKVRDHYMAMLDDCANREDVAYLQAEMVSELNIGHAYITSPGDVESPGPAVAVGLLGCDYALDKTPQGSAYRITAIHRGAPWDLDARSPLDTPGEKKPVAVGDYLLAVNGVPIDTSRDPWAAFIGLADKPTLITVSAKPLIDGSAREILVRPIASEVGLRYRAWIERNRKYVEEKTGGKVGYIYVPNTGLDGQNDLYRQFVGQRGHEGLIIDERWNGGGQIPTRFIELLDRKVTNYWAKRSGADWTWPPDGHFGPKCMLVNGLAGSGGDMFPWLFKHNKVGKVIGTRTWGGLVGISGNPGLIDGGSISVPTFGFYETDGTWGVEGHGVDPDMVVIDDPGLMLKGGDPQLDAAIAHMLEEIRTRPHVPPARPKSPNRSGMGLDPADR